MIRRLGVLAVVCGAVAAVTFTLPDWALFALAVLAWGVWWSFARPVRSPR